MFRLCLQLLLLRLQSFVFQKSLKEGQRECIRRMVCLKEDNVVMLPTGFGNSVIYSPEHSRNNALFHFHRLENVCSCGKLVSPLEYIRKQQVPEKEPNRTLVLPHLGNQPSLTEKFDVFYGSGEQWFSDTLLTK